MWNSKNARHEHYRACTVIMVITDRICLKEGRFAPILYWIQNAKRCDCQVCLPNPANGRYFGLPRRSGHIFDVRRPFWVLAYWNRRPNQGQNDFHVAPQTYRLLRMPLGLKNTPSMSTCFTAMNIILSTVKWQFVLMYLDDVFIFSKSSGDILYHLRTTLGLL